MIPLFSCFCVWFCLSFKESAFDYYRMWMQIEHVQLCQDIIVVAIWYQIQHKIFKSFEKLLKVLSLLIWMWMPSQGFDTNNAGYLPFCLRIFHLHNHNGHEGYFLCNMHCISHHFWSNGKKMSKDTKNERLPSLPTK